ncbi:MAG: zf-HC2 domain-containing protein, partial [Acidobacteria bacterium]|nr:zf-HC2 domain-containing protein [Acidobacteriota bacterium]
TDYLEGVLPSEERARFEEHLSQCPGCEIYLEQIRQIIRTLGKLNEDSIPPPARETLLQAFRNWKQTR